MHQFTTRPTSLQRHCACRGACDSCRREKEPLRRSALSNAPRRQDVPPLVHDVLRGAERPLDAAARAFFEPRFAADFTRVPVAHVPQRLAIGEEGDASEREADRFASTVVHEQPAGAGRADLGAVRVHTDARAAESAAAVHARAYTVGSHIVFGAGEYAPASAAGRELLAHELAHVAQQGMGVVRRKLVVRGDDLKKAPPAKVVSTVKPVLKNLCPDFDVSAAGDVTSTAAKFCGRRDAIVTKSKKPAGCCCLCVLTDPAVPTWTLQVAASEGPTTEGPPKRLVTIPPIGDVEFGAWSEVTKTTGKATPAHRLMLPIEAVVGHELCGHAALMEIGSHPRDDTRMTSNVHDPTVRVERRIEKEQGIASSNLRGLAASGPHRGESFGRIVIEGFAVGSAAVAATQNTRVNTAAGLIKKNDWFVDLIGHAETVEASPFVLSENRALAVRTALQGAGVTDKTSHNVGKSVDRFTTIAGSGPLAGSGRRVEIFMANYPAGAQTPPPGTPKTIARTAPIDPAAQTANLKSKDPCIRLLTETAWK